MSSHETAAAITPAPSITSGTPTQSPSGAGAVQLKAALHGQGYAAQSAALAPRVQKKAATTGAAVQRVPNSSQSATPEQQAIVDQRATDRGTTLGDRALTERGASLGTGQVNENEAVSMAENVDFEKDALALEKNLGVSAYSRGQGPADAMTTKARDYLLTKVGGTEWKASTAALEAQLKLIGSDNAAWSGSVGLGFQNLLDALNTGNVGVKMCHMENFYTKILVPDLKADIAPIDDLLKGVEPVKKAQAEEKLNALKTGHGGAPFAIPNANSEVHGQSHTRGEQNEGGPSAPSTQTGASIGVPLDPAEFALQQGADQAGKTAAETKMRWEEGAQKWALNEKNKWVFLMRELSVPLMAGPSGTTNKLMNLGTALGMDPYETRLACMGYLMPARHHSLVEIMAAAAPHGASDFIVGRQMYTSIKPWGPGDLKGFGGGKFPHETHGDRHVVGDQVVTP